MKRFGFSLIPVVMAVFAVLAEAPEDVRLRLEKAREDVALAAATEARIADRLVVLEEDPEVSPEVVAAMESYLEEVSQMRRGFEEALKALEALAAEAPDPAVAEGMHAFSASLAALPEAEEEDGELARMIAEFDASLSQFDGVIHDHLASLRNRMDRRLEVASAEAGPRARAAAEAAELLRSMGVDPGVSGEGGREEGQEGGREGGLEGGLEPGRQGEPQASRPGRVAGAERQAGEDAAPRRNEDIVARQLREAAEKETDPVLREKLWKEYEAYLDGRS